MQDRDTTTATAVLLEATNKSGLPVVVFVFMDVLLLFWGRY